MCKVNGVVVCSGVSSLAPYLPAANGNLVESLDSLRKAWKKFSPSFLEALSLRTSDLQKSHFHFKLEGENANDVAVAPPPNIF